MASENHEAAVGMADEAVQADPVADDVEMTSLKGGQVVASNVPQEPSVVCVATDETDSDWSRSRYSYTLSLSSAVTDLYSALAKEAGYVEGTFELVWRKQEGSSTSEELVTLDWKSTATLHEMGMPSEPSKCYLLIKECADGSQPKKVSDNREIGAARSVQTSTSANYLNNASSGASAISSSTPSYSRYSYNMKSDTGFVGLVNQAMTCYLNSMLQTLYMTPEFRNALYNWKFSGDINEGAKSIPYQLQRLFIHLQTSSKRAVETTDVTKSFGWDSSEAWQQHDVQELCRVMFDALEKRFRKDGYERSELINELYQGSMKDYVKCLECGYESARKDHYLDIPLVIKPFGSTTAYGSVEEALRGFVQGETLDADNRYFCEKCNKKCDAHKGLKFLSFPYLLTLQLKRFDFDYTTLHRIKLNDRMTFPHVLDLNEFIEGGEDMPESPGPKELEELYSSFVVEKFDNKPPPYSASYVIKTPSESESEAHPQPDIAKLLQHGPYVYELFSIMVHSGSAIGGHYYAYIKNFTDRQWYCFNDQSVSRITKDDIEQTYGGSDSKSRGYYSSMYASSANAYMLMYRRINRRTNIGFTTTEKFPSHIVKQIDDEREYEKREKERQEWEKNLCKFRLFCKHPETKELFEKRLEMHKDRTLPEATQEAYRILGLKGVVPLERCRLVKYDEYSETLDQSFDELLEDVTFGHHVGGARTYYSFELFMEIRKEGESFKVYNKGGLNLKVLVIDLPSREVRDPVHIRAEQAWTVGELKQNLAKELSLDAASMNLALETYQNEGKQLTNDEQVLKQEGFYRKHTVFVCCDPEDFQKAFSESEMNKVIDKHANSILLHITVPPPPRQQPVSSEKLHGESDVDPPPTNSTSKSSDDSSSNSNPTSTSDDNPTSLAKENNDPSPVDSTQPTQNGGKESSWSEANMEDKDRPLQRTIAYRIDRRSTLADLKKALEDFIKLPSSEFKVYRVYSNNQEYEMFRLQDSLTTVPNETRLVVKLGRALKTGEFRIKLSLLRVNEVEFFKPLFDSIVAKDMTIRQFKERIVEEAYKQGIEYPLRVDRFRLRKKTWRSPGTIYPDSHIIEKDVHVFANFEMYIEPLEGPDLFAKPTDMQVYVRHWRPSSYTLDPIKEIILTENTPDHLKLKISELSGIPVERVEFAKAHGSFPCEVSVLEVENDMDWNPDVSTISTMPLSIYDDGAVVYFKDSQEKLADLPADKRSELQKQENARLSKYSMSGPSYNFRKERPLVIKTDDDDISSQKQTVAES